jgi:hypothetical protein
LLSTLADYYAATGDAAFLRDHWQQIDAAYAYCRSLIDPETALPKIPAGKEGGNEQDRMSEDVGLSAAWVTASAAYRALALAASHPDEAAAAAAPAEAARRALTARYWDEQKHFWIAGYSASGARMTDERSHPDLLGQGLFTPDRENAALDRLAGSGFETDWGARNMSSASPGYDPKAYASGSVFALSTEDMAQAFWRDHRPAIAAPVFESLLPWLQLDALGHIHEVADGDRFQPEMESVPEQTWSSSGFLHAVIRGLFGLEVDAAQHTLTMAPHLDPRWDRVSIAQIPVGDAHADVDIRQQPGEVAATFTTQSGTTQSGTTQSGTTKSGPVAIVFDPEIPLGAAHVRALVDGRSASVALEPHAEDQHARVAFDLPSGSAIVRILFSGGLRVRVPVVTPARGDFSRGLRLTALHLDGRTLTLDADVASADQSSVEIETPWTVAAVNGGTATRLSQDWYRVTFAMLGEAATSSSAPPVTSHRSMTIAFAGR